MKKSNYKFLTYTLIQITQWMTYSIFMGNTSMYLLDHKFSNTDIGILIAITGLMCTILQPLIAGYADRPESISLKNIMLIICSIGLVFSILLILTFNSSKLIQALFFLVSMIVVQLFAPFVNALAITGEEPLSNTAYSISRGFGSLLFSISTFIIGHAVARMGSLFMDLYAVVMYIFMIIVLFIFPYRKNKKEIPESKEVRDSGPSGFSFVTKYKGFIFVLLAAMALHTGHTIVNSYLLQIIISRGGDAADNGTASFIAAFMEFPLMLLYPLMRKKWDAGKWLITCSFFFLIKNICLLLSGNLTGIFLTQFIQCMGWALECVASVDYIGSIMSAGDAVKGQAYFTSMQTLAMIIASLSGGVLLDTLGVNTAILFSIIITIAGVIFMTLGVTMNMNAKKL